MKRILLAAALALSACATAQTPTQPVAVDPAAAGWNAAALADVVAYVADKKTTGFLIIQDRKVIYEHNWPLGPGSETFASTFVHGAALTVNIVWRLGVLLLLWEGYALLLRSPNSKAAKATREVSPGELQF